LPAPSAGTTAGARPDPVAARQDAAGASTDALAATPVNWFPDRSKAATAVGATVRAVVRAPFARRTWAELFYAVVNGPLATFAFGTVVVFLVLGVFLALTFVGLPLIALGGLAARRLGRWYRDLARGLLGERAGDPPRLAPGPGFLGWLRSALRDPVGWRARVYVVVKFPLALATFYIAITVWFEGLLLLTYPIWWQLSGPPPHGVIEHTSLLDGAALIGRGTNAVGAPPEAHSFTMQLGGLYFDTWLKALLLVLVGAGVLLIAPWLVRGLVGIDRLLIRGLLGPTRRSERVRQLEESRAQVVDDSAATLRRIERDLHDGTQAQLVALAMNLGQAREKLDDRADADVPFDPAGARELVDTAHRHAKEALLELRDIARGIHPPALDVGLDAALATLVARSAVPAEAQVDIRTRPSEAIESIAYFSAAELLTNVAKHSGARRATVEATEHNRDLLLRVTDDGIGGARIGAGTGLAGLTDRVHAVDGSIRISSPPGGPTKIVIVLPLRS
jgi:signal transduction histidine kinase